MANRYFVWKSIPINPQDIEWAEISGTEFYQLLKSPAARGRYFIDMDDFILEVSKENHDQWHREKERLNYRKKKLLERGFTVISLYSDAISENGSGEDVIPDDMVFVEEESLLIAEVRDLYSALAKLDKASRQLIYDLYLAKEPKSLRQLSRETGVPVMTLQDRKKRIFLQLKQILSRKS